MPKPLLQIRNLKKGFPDLDGTPRPIVDIQQFDIPEGGEIGLRGGSGTGKTTFLHLVAGLLRPDSGSIVLDGEDLVALSEPARDRLRAIKIGYVVQSFNLLQGCTCLENVETAMLFGGRVDKSRAEALLARVGLDHRMGHRPRQLSHGQQQRVAVARALANRPRLVLADEPTGSLDPASAAQVLALTREVCRENGAALLLVSHDRHVLADLAEVREFESLNRTSVQGGER